jgi:hypothetical protein
MLDRRKAIDALQTKREQFTTFAGEQRRQTAVAAEKLAVFHRLTAAEILQLLAERNVPWPGAEPTAELDKAPQLCLPFAQRWQNHEDARAWARDVLRDAPVAGVDGSQIMPSKELSLPVAAVQVGWYINYHAPGGRYEKDVRFEVMAPDELASDDSGGEFGDWRVNQRRFVLECEQLCALMERFAAEPSERRPLCLFDGSLIISFAGQLRPERGMPYVRAVEQLLETSRALRVPLAGFVDSSSSKDVLTLVNTVTGPPYLSLTDGALLEPLLPAWGDRSPLFVCARADMLSTQGRASYYREVVFSYVHLAQDRPPARIEMPRWLWEEGRAQQVLDLVRAECVVGAKGYPYAAETADAVAVLQGPDRERFYALFQQFIEAQGLALNRSRKSLSKVARRS